ncbi:MAG: glycosyltransferase family 39 protein [Lewinellaceae bacterium]|nr:glycosyltransferase family 39 protein [Lewinellaceae bacterium]
MNRLSPTHAIPLLFAAIKIAIHLATVATFGFHRDEFLYLAQGRHPDWGFWSNPPFTGAMAWCSQQLLGGSLWATRLPSVLAIGALMWLVLRMVAELGGSARAQFLCGLVMLISPAWLRTGTMLQPVPFDIFFWALLSYGLLRWINTRDRRWWWFIGLVAGIAFLNKYTMVFWAAAMLIALLVSKERKMLIARPLWMAVALALLIALPNLLWQWHYHFPVIHHMEDLARYQLQNVQPVNFLLDQLLMNGPGFMWWLAGLLFLLFSVSMRPYRVFAWFYLALMLIFLVLSGKSYYTLGAYPVLFSAGAVCWERLLRHPWQQYLLAGAVVANGLPLVPVGIPLYSGQKAVDYYHWLTCDLGIEGAVRWEDGNLHALPQDFADMLGWDELAGLADRAIDAAGGAPFLLYGDNYGQAGAVGHLSKRLPAGAEAVSFSDAYRLWAPDRIDPAIQTLIYINDDEAPGKDVQNLFAEIQLIGRIENPLAREHGTGVWLCRQPRGDFAAFWAERVRQVKAVLR